MNCCNTGCELYTTWVDQEPGDTGFICITSAWWWRKCKLQHCQGVGICERWIKKISERALLWIQVLTLEQYKLLHQISLWEFWSQILILAPTLPLCKALCVSENVPCLSYIDVLKESTNFYPYSFNVKTYFLSITIFHNMAILVNKTWCREVITLKTDVTG